MSHFSFDYVLLLDASKFGVRILLLFTNLTEDLFIARSRGSSGSIVSDYGLDETENFFSSLCVQSGSEAHPASSPMGMGVLSSGAKI
jgi:hypothetical protein